MISTTFFKTKDYCKVKFTLQMDADAVAVYGLNNDWKTPIDLKKKKDGSFVAEVNLPKESQHEFKFFVNNQEWFLDQEFEAVTANSFGTLNHVLSL